MKVFIVAKTRMGDGACIGAISFDGLSVRLISADAKMHEQESKEYNVGEVWDITAKPAPRVVAPHVENILVYQKQWLSTSVEPIRFIEDHMPPKIGGPDVLFNGLTQKTKSDALYVSDRSGIPSYSTMFWRPEQPLILDSDSKRLRYRYPGENGGCTLSFVGYQEPIEVIPAGTLLRVSLAKRWRPDDEPDTELRCYVQLSGWFLSDNIEIDDDGEDDEIIIDPTPPDAPKSLLRSIFGYDEFRPLQEEIMDNVLHRRDTLVIMPTGGGKSLCYQLPALLMKGLTVVVSPLISLMQDQVDQLQQLGVTAVYLNSSLSHHDYVATTHRIKRGEVKLLYVAPETLLRPETLVMLEECQLDCLTIDEAHCISQWGHDFRPEYRQLVDVRRRFPQAVCVALTATATPRVQNDIKHTLGFRDENEFMASFDRQNLLISVVSKNDILQQAIDFLAKHPNQSGIIYCNTQRRVDSLHADLVANGISALPYHAGLDSETRRHNQNAFIRDDVSIIVATIAFGMGIDKPDVRFVLHVDLPKDMENYYQQIGRAGRDGLRADCLLLLSYGDVQTIRYFIQQGAESEATGRSLRLEALVHWAESDECRRRQLLAYFGESYQNDNCQMCDNCLRGDQGQIDITIPAQKFLSCVVRTRQIFGMAHIIKVLRGSKSKAIFKHGHDQLSTYGIGTEFSMQQWKHLARQFIRQGLIVQNRDYLGLQLTDKGKMVLKGEPVWGTLDETATETTEAATALEVYDRELFQQLRLKRKELADEAGVPPYIIFPDRTLQEMAIYFPHSVESFRTLHGVGQIKVERYAELFLPLIRAYCERHQLDEKSKSRRQPRLRRAVRNRSVEVGERFQQGESINDLVTRYGIKRQTVVAHLEKYVQAGHIVSAERLQMELSMSPSIQMQIFEVFDKLGIEYLRPTFDAFQSKISFDELHLNRVIYRLKTNCTAKYTEAEQISTGLSIQKS